MKMNAPENSDPVDPVLVLTVLTEEDSGESRSRYERRCCRLLQRSRYLPYLILRVLEADLHELMRGKRIIKSLYDSISKTVLTDIYNRIEALRC